MREIKHTKDYFKAVEKILRERYEMGVTEEGIKRVLFTFLRNLRISLYRYRPVELIHFIKFYHIPIPTYLKEEWNKRRIKKKGKYRRERRKR